MPTLNDIATVADSMGQCRIKVAKDACVVVRNRNASCRACEEVCPHGAIKAEANNLVISSSLCVECGACVAVCPTEALISLEPTDAELAEAAARSLAANDGVVVFACARMAAKQLADPERFATVPCLARLEESLLLALVGAGASELVLVDGTCATCKHRECVLVADELIEQVDNLLAAHGSAVRVQRTSAFPVALTSEDARTLRGSSRRGFFSDAARSAREAAMSAAQATIAKELGIDSAERSIGERLRVGEDGRMPLVGMPRHERAINALDTIGMPCVDVISSRLFGTVSINLDKCNACGVCTVFCPTGALRRDPTKKMSETVSYLEFSACECVQCGLCADACWKRCITVSPDVPADELYDFEPRTFIMQKNNQRRNPAW